ncbi:MAG: hypothetical protein IJO32_02455 [Bacilli bacterium]|nr:hypothetical protein [Bacilli bacterium]
MKNIIKNIKSVLKKEYYIREMVLLVVISLSLLCFGLYESLALFQTNIEKSSVATIIAGDINFALTSTNSKYNSSTGQITVSAGETIKLPLTITNNTPISAKYKLYYKSITPETLPDGVSIKVSAESEEKFDEGILESSASVERTIKIENTSTSNITLKIGVEKGYAHNELVLSEGNNNQLEMEIVKSIPYFVDTSNANEPVLADGMIPVVYDDDEYVWVVADQEKGYYAYQDQIWANAVTVSDATYRTAEAGTSIPMDSINSMWVWIPRYKYKIPSNIGSSENVINPPQIDVVFESGTDATGVSETVYRNGIASDGTNTNYYTHPAFRDVNNIEYDSSTTSRGAWDEEITGFWAGKFEMGTTNEDCINSYSCNDVEPIIKPDVQSLWYQNMYFQFITALKFSNGTMDTTTGVVTFSTNSNNIYGLNTTSNTTDTHMMKNTEWGAVAILSQSQYGKMGNDNYTDTNKEIYINNSFHGYLETTYTGRSGGNPSEYETSYGSYSYNNKICGAEECIEEEMTFAGTGASTTGTIYGIYDMSGGLYEHTMGNWDEQISKSKFSKLPVSKYYDLYQGTSSSNITKEKAILGDATFETMKWYSDNASFVYASTPWASRGGNFNISSNAGVFYSYNHDGYAYIDYSFRSTLIP